MRPQSYTITTWENPFLRQCQTTNYYRCISLSALSPWEDCRKLSFLTNRQPQLLYVLKFNIQRRSDNWIHNDKIPEKDAQSLHWSGFQRSATSSNHPAATLRNTQKPEELCMGLQCKSLLTWVTSHCSKYNLRIKHIKFYCALNWQACFIYSTVCCD